MDKTGCSSVHGGRVADVVTSVTGCIWVLGFNFYNCLAVLVTMLDQMSWLRIEHLNSDYTRISIGIRAGILFCHLMRSMGDTFWYLARSYASTDDWNLWKVQWFPWMVPWSRWMYYSWQELCVTVSGGWQLAFVWNNCASIETYSNLVCSWRLIWWSVWS